MATISIDPKPVLSKIIAEIRFRPNLNYFSDAFKIASTFESDFEDWQTSHNPYQATLYSSNNYEILRISSDSIAVIFEGDYKEEWLKKRLDQVIQLLFLPSKLEEIRRIGVRKIEILKTDAKFVTLADKIATAFTNNFDKHTELSLDMVEDYAFVLDGIKNGFKNHVRFGPVKPEEATDRFSSSFPLKANLKDNSVYLDIDIFNDEIVDIEELSSNIDGIIKEASRVTEGYKKLLETEVK